MLVIVDQKEEEAFFPSPVTAPEVEVKQNIKREKNRQLPGQGSKTREERVLHSIKSTSCISVQKFAQSVLFKCGCVKVIAAKMKKKMFLTLAGNFFRNSTFFQNRYETFLLSHHVAHSQMHI